jgi:hypothetical protein
MSKDSLVQGTCADPGAVCMLPDKKENGFRTIFSAKRYKLIRLRFIKSTEESIPSFTSLLHP